MDRKVRVKVEFLVGQGPGWERQTLDIGWNY